MRKGTASQKGLSRGGGGSTQHLQLNSPKTATTATQLFRPSKGKDKPQQLPINNSKSKIKYYASQPSLGPRRQSLGNLTKPKVN